MASRVAEKSRSLGRNVLAILLAVAVLGAALLSSSPSWHESLHHGRSASHACLATLSAAGQYDATAAPPVLIAPSPALIFALQPAVEHLSLSPAHFFSLLEHAPPAFA